MKKALFPLVLTFSLFARIAAGGYYEETYGIKLGYKSSPLELVDSEFTSDLGLVNLEFILEDEELLFLIKRTEFQLVPAGFVEDRSTKEVFVLQPPRPQRIHPSHWRRLGRGMERNRLAVSLEAPEARNYRSLYELWSCNSYEEHCDIGAPRFLGYVTVRNKARSLADFLAQQPLFSKVSELNEQLKKSVNREESWTRVEIRLEGKDEPQAYQFVSVLGNGQDGIVLKAVPMDSKNPIVALKAWPNTLSPVNDHKIENEILGRRSVISRNAAVLLFPKEQPVSGMRILVMEYIDGVTLGQYLDEHPSLSLATAQRILTPTFEVLLNSCLKLYDMTLDNMMVIEHPKGSELLQVKLIDFCKFEYGQAMSDDRVRSFVRNLLSMLMDRVSQTDRETLEAEFSKRLNAGLGF